MNHFLKEAHHRDLQKVTWVSFVVNLVLAIAQVSIGLWAKSSALVADGVHSFSDLMSDVVALWAQHHGRKEPDEDHQYGHHRFETAATLVLGLVLIVVAVGMMVHATINIQSGAYASGIHPIALVAAIVTLIGKESLFRYMRSVANRLKSKLLLANAWHARSDAASSLVVVIALVGSLLGFPVLDSIASIIVGLMIGKMGWSFAWDALQDLVDRSADTKETDAILATLLGTQGLKGVHELRTRKMGDWTVVDVHLEVDARLTVEEGHDIAKEANERVLSSHRVLHVMTHVDPWYPDKTE